MRVRLTLRARADLEEIHEYLEKWSPAAAKSVIANIERSVSWLQEFPYIARVTDEAGVYELTLARHPYKIYYEIEDDEVRILHIRHARRRPWKRG
jgi:toxin ParE1/3/4